MTWELIVQPDALEALGTFAAENERKFAKVQKTLGLMQSNLRHPGLHTHKVENRKGPGGEDVFEAYVENHTPGAYRIFWHYGPEQGSITILAITPHP